MADVLHGSGIRWLIQCANRRLGYYHEPTGLWVADVALASLYAERPPEEKLVAFRDRDKTSEFNAFAVFVEPEFNMRVPQGWRELSKPEPVRFDQDDAGLHPLMTP